MRHIRTTGKYVVHIYIRPEVNVERSCETELKVLDVALGAIWQRIAASDAADQPRSGIDGGVTQTGKRASQ